jgi:alanyl-tRNA synthetase
MTSAEIRQSFLDFFRSKQHTIVQSSSLLPEAPNLLFTNAGMNQFVPFFLGAVKCPYSPPRAVDTQKCIRAGGKHNDLEDVGLDTYHHTFFEMLGNWSFGDPDAHDSIGAGYFKREAIDWAWELLVQRWKFPKERLYATYFGGDNQIPADLEARDFWLWYLPRDHVLPSGRKDNFWMMGDTGPCGPCSEIHMDLTPAGNTQGKLVNKGDAQCIEIWNLVFIQFNADGTGEFPPLPAKHVDTGMGFERVCGIIQCTDNLRDFSRRISNYETDAFRPLFHEIEKLSGRQYGGTLPGQAGAAEEQIKTDIAFRVIADHIRCLSLAIADGIMPSNEGRGYVLRRILRRAVRYGRNLGLHEPFFYKLVDMVAAMYNGVFPEVIENQEKIEMTLFAEEENFNRTLDRGLDIFAEATTAVTNNVFPAEEAFQLYDTYGFPLDLTELMARERGFTVDVEGFEQLMAGQRQRAREDHEKKKTTVTVVDDGLKITPTKFLGYENLEAEAVIEAVTPTEKHAEFELILDQTPFYAEMGGQVGDSGLVSVPGREDTKDGALEVLDTQRRGGVYVHRAQLLAGREPMVGEAVNAIVDTARRINIERHHTVTHLFHWALHEVVSKDARQRGSLVAPERMRFDFNHPERLTDQQLADIERLVNARIKENAPVFWFDLPYAEIKSNPKVMQFFGDKYGPIVRVVKIGGTPYQLDGFSMELCGGTHTKSTGELGLFKIARESGIAAGVRRIEAVCSQFATEFVENAKSQQASEAEREKARQLEKEQAKRQQAQMQQQAPSVASELIVKVQRVGDVNLIAENLGAAGPELLRVVVDDLKVKFPSGIVVLSGVAAGKVALICTVTPDQVEKGKHAGKIIKEVAKICGGGGAGMPEFAQAGARNPDKLLEALAAVPEIITREL